MVVFCGEGGIAVPQHVHHGAAGDNNGSKQSADAVLEGWKLRITTRKGKKLKKGKKSFKQRQEVERHQTVWI